MVLGELFDHEVAEFLVAGGALLVRVAVHDADERLSFVLAGRRFLEVETVSFGGSGEFLEELGVVFG